ncbi:MAG: hypothetical protein IJ217_00720 [Clostridia bacterium]|nr:hypothetical protein [Clostridia bacterium]
MKSPSMHISKKKLSDIENISIDDKFVKIIKGIYIIENYYRNKLFRSLEYIFLFFNIILNIFFKIEIKNLTLGQFQIGITSILIYYGYSELNIHDKKIKKINFKQLTYILKSIKWKNNLEICVWKLTPIYNQLLMSNTDLSSLAGNIGEYYNGEMSYGFSLQRLVNKI